MRFSMTFPVGPLFSRSQLLAWIAFCLLSAASSSVAGDGVESLEKQYQQQFAAGHYDEAERAAKRLSQIVEQQVGRRHPLYANVLGKLAEVYRAQGRYADAVLLHQQALAIEEKALGPQSVVLEITLNNLAYAYVGQGRYADALPLLQHDFLLDPPC
jgi:tetratricopeptide (TPR) repeat protein